MKGNENTKYIWDGAVGVRIREKLNKQTGEAFHSFEFVRCYKTGDSDEMKYSSNFTCRNAEALGRVIQKTIWHCTDASSRRLEDVTQTKHVVGKIDVVQVPASEAIS